MALLHDELKSKFSVCEKSAYRAWDAVSLILNRKNKLEEAKSAIWQLEKEFKEVGIILSEKRSALSEYDRLLTNAVENLKKYQESKKKSYLEEAGVVMKLIGRLWGKEWGFGRSYDEKLSSLLSGMSSSSYAGQIYRLESTLLKGWRYILEAMDALRLEEEGTALVAINNSEKILKTAYLQLGDVEKTFKSFYNEILEAEELVSGPLIGGKFKKATFILKDFYDYSRKLR